MSKSHRYAFVTGTGQTEYSKKTERSAEQLAIEAALAAAEDAGIAPTDIDGLIGYPGHVGDDTLIFNLDLPYVRFRATIDIGGASAVSALRLASMAVMAGAANHVLLFRAIKGNSGLRKNVRPSHLPGLNLREHLEWPHGLNTPAQRYSLLCQRYRYEHGLPREVLGEIAVTSRAHANLNPSAQMYGRELTMEQYLSGRLIADPYCLYDCSLETDGACAVIVSARPDPAARQDRTVQVISVGEAPGAMPIDISNRQPFLDIGIKRAAAEVWEKSGIDPEDVDTAMIYDCFTFELLHQLEDSGLIGVSDVLGFVRDGNIRLGGRLPVNTHGGLLSEAHMVGLNHVIEAVRQIRGEAGERQVPSARIAAVTGWGNLGDCSFALLGGKNV